jgi:hypothetical protein
MFVEQASSAFVTSHLNDDRELIPEFYFQLKFIHNDSEFDLGISKGKKVDDVVLPGWADRSGSVFVYIMRKALESDPVSSSLHEWIDLMFGCKQSGSAAEEADNLFSPDMYDSAWTPESLRDPARRAEIEAVMCHVGQVPARLFNAPHPRRAVERLAPLLQKTVIVALSDAPITACCVAEGQLLTFGNRSLARYAVVVRVDQPPICETRRMLILSEIGSIVVTPNDRLAVLSTAKLVSVDAPNMPVAFPSLVNVSHIAASGDCLAIVSDEATLNLVTPSVHFHIQFYGDSIACCALSRPFGIAVAGTVSGCIQICSLAEGTKVNVISLGEGFLLLRVLVTDAWGFILTCAAVDRSVVREHSIFVHSVNGRLIRCVKVSFVVTAWCMWSSRKAFDWVIVATDNRKALCSEAFDAKFEEPVHRCGATPVAVAYVPDSRVALIVQKDGQVVFLTLGVD